MHYTDSTRGTACLDGSTFAATPELLTVVLGVSPENTPRVMLLVKCSAGQLGQAAFFTVKMNCTRTATPGDEGCIGSGRAGAHC